MAETDFQWTQDSWDLPAEAVERRASSRNERLAWFGVVALAVVAFELTADPALTVSLGCLKFGWDEFRLARWLKRTDPNRTRGKICSRFYLAWGLWRISLVATAMAFILAFVYLTFEAQLGKVPGAGGPPPGFGSAFLVALVGFFLSSMVSSIAVLSALRHRVKVWVGPEAGWAREAKTWPPQAVGSRRLTSNRTKAILLSAIITLVMVGILVIVIPLSSAFPQRKLAGPVFIVGFMSFVIGVPISILVLLETLGNRMIALTPKACWGSPVDSPDPGTWPGS